MTSSKSAALGQLYTNSEPNTVWNNIYQTMTEESFIGRKAVKKVQNSNQLLTLHTYLENVKYLTEPCALKELWRSTSKSLESIAFPKGSPLVPFFKNTYNKIRQTGTLFRLKEKWKQLGKSSKSCNANILKPISFNKIVSLILVLFFGICSTLFIVSLEIAVKSRQGKKKNIKSKTLKDCEE